MFFHTDPHYTQPLIQSNRRSRSTTSGWCLTREHGERNSLFIYLILLFVLSHRHSQNSTSNPIKSALKGYYIWLMPYERIRWEKQSLHLFHLVVCSFTQTLTTLILSFNQIGAKGALHLADALRVNTVRETLSSSVASCCLCFHTDTHYTQPLGQSNRRSRGTTSGWYLTKEHGEKNSLFICLILLFVLSHRPSLHSTSHPIKSAIKGHNIWLMPYERTRWEKQSLHLSDLVICSFTQTLTELNLRGNRIGDQGAQHLADALRENTVRETVSSSISSCCLFFHTDTHRTRPRIQSNRR